MQIRVQIQKLYQPNIVLVSNVGFSAFDPLNFFFISFSSDSEWRREWIESSLVFFAQFLKRSTFAQNFVEIKWADVMDKINNKNS